MIEVHSLLRQGNVPRLMNDLMDAIAKEEEKIKRLDEFLADLDSENIVHDEAFVDIDHGLEQQVLELRSELTWCDSMFTELCQQESAYQTLLEAGEKDGFEKAQVLASLHTQHDRMVACRNALKQTNALNDAFCIWYDGHLVPSVDCVLAGCRRSSWSGLRLMQRGVRWRCCCRRFRIMWSFHFRNIGLFPWDPVVKWPKWDMSA